MRRGNGIERVSGRDKVKTKELRTKYKVVRWLVVRVVSKLTSSTDTVNSGLRFDPIATGICKAMGSLGII